MGRHSKDNIWIARQSKTIFVDLYCGEHLYVWMAVKAEGPPCFYVELNDDEGKAVFHVAIRHGFQPTVLHS